MNWIAVSFVLYTLIVMGFGVYSARLSKSTSSDFFLADRGLGAWVAALSSAASAESGWVTLGLVGMAYRTGVGALWIIPGTVAAFLFIWLIMANPLRAFSQRTGSITLPDVLAADCARPISAAIRLLSVLIILAMLTTYVAAQLSAAGKSFNACIQLPVINVSPVTNATYPITYRQGVVCGAAIVLIYTLIGGFRAVAWTDVLQAALMITAVTILPVVMIVDLGGPSEFWGQLKSSAAAATRTNFLAGKTGLAFFGFLSTWIGIPLGYPGQPHVLMRLMATKDEQAVVRAAYISSIWVFILFMGAIAVGMAASVAFPHIEDPEQSLPHAAAHYLPAPLAGMVIAAVIAAICSTADSQLLVCASSVAHDLYVKLFDRTLGERTLSWINRGAVLLIGLIATGIAVKEPKVIFDFVLSAWDVLGAAFGPALILKLLWKRTTAAAVFMGILVGSTTALVWRNTLHQQLYSLIPAFAIALAVVWFTSLLGAKRAKA